MSKKKRRKQKPRAEPTPSPSPPTRAAIRSGSGTQSTAEIQSHVRVLLEQGRDKEAVEKAKVFHKAEKSAESEALVVSAYRVRIRSMRSRGLVLEADSLQDLIAGRYKSARELFGEHGDDDKDGTGSKSGLDATLRQLEGYDALEPVRKRQLDGELKRKLTDPGRLARTSFLPEEHPLRQAAAAVENAFERVTRGPVPEDDPALVLDGVSRRGPLAPWKALIRALAAFYRADDGACREWLASIETGTPPERLVPVVRGMLDLRVPEGATPPVRNLTTTVAGGDLELAKRLEVVDQISGSPSMRIVLDRFRSAFASCRKHRPEMLSKLNRLLIVRSFLMKIPQHEAENALGELQVRDFQSCLLMARALEDMACSLYAAVEWRLAIGAAISEGVFEEQSIEAASLYRHIARTLQKADVDDLLDLQEDDEFGDVPRPEIDIPLDPCELLWQASRMDPDAETFRELWQALRSASDAGSPPERALEAWAKAVPGDAEPCLLLAESAESRGTLTLATKWIETAAERAAADPRVRQARIRLGFAILRKHLSSRKSRRTLIRDLKQLGELPAIDEGCNPACVDALSLAVQIRCGSKEAEAAPLESLKTFVDRPAALVVLLHSLSADLGQELDGGSQEPGAEWSPGDGAPLVRALTVLRSLGAPLVLPEQVRGSLEQALRADRHGLDAAGLLLLCEAAVKGGLNDLAYAATVPALELGEAEAAPFLILRALSMPALAGQRREELLAAASALARAHRLEDVVRRAVDLQHDERNSRSSFVLASRGEDLAYSPGRAREILREERKRRTYAEPAARRSGSIWCPSCAAYHDAVPAFRPGKGPSKVSGRRPKSRRDTQQGTLFNKTSDELPDEMEGPGVDKQKVPGLIDLVPEALLREAWVAMVREELNIPDSVARLMLEFVEKHGGLDGDLPDLDDIAETDPFLYAKIIRAAASAPRSASQPGGPKKKRKKRPKPNRKRR